MKNNYKKIILTGSVIILPWLAEAAVTPSAAAVWFDPYDDDNDQAFTSAPYDYASGSGTISRARANRINTDTVTFWNSGEPNDSGGEDCAVQLSSGLWNDSDCGDSLPVACFDGSNWSISATPVVMGSNNNSAADISAAASACAAGSEFSAPQTLAQQAALAAVVTSAGASSGVWINAQDMSTEGVWVLNQGTSLSAPFWESGQPDNAAGNEGCAQSSAAGLWRDADCTQQQALACADLTLNNWQVTADSYAFTSVDDLSRRCQQAFGSGYQFAAPRTADNQSQLNNAMNSAGLSLVWINGRDDVVENYWFLNHGLFNWAAGFPDDSEGICTTARQTDGQWLSSDCDSRAALLCSNGDTWVIRNASHQFSNQALEACERPDDDTSGTNNYLGYYLAAPRSEQERALVSRLLQAQSTGTLIWINLKRITDTDSWLWNEGYDSPDIGGGDLSRAVWYDLLDDSNEFLDGPWTRYTDGSSIDRDQALLENKGVRAYFNEGEPNDSGDCVQLYTSGDNAGLWDDTSCGNSKQVACFDGYQWAVSAAATTLGADDDSAEDISAAHNTCAAVERDGISGNFVFAAPVSFAQSQALLTVAQDSGAGNIWINVNDKQYERTFVYNLGMDVLAPFWNDGEPNDAGSGEDCAVQQQGSERWNDVACSTVLPLACFNPYDGANGSWNITAAGYEFTSPQALALICENEFGGPYKFYAPVTLSQRNDLLTAMAAAGQTNVYINADDQDSEGTWLLNREINNWNDGEPSALSSERCVSVSAADGRWQSRSCDEFLPVACTSGGRWYFSAAEISLTDFSAAQQVCDALGNGYLFSAPRSYDSALQIPYFAALTGVGGDFWINGNRLEDFSRWDWNQFHIGLPAWGSSQPDGGSGENCALLNNDTVASWSDEACNSATDYRYLCRNGASWAVSALAGELADFSAAVSACADLGSGWVFAAPETYNENLAAKNALGSVAAVWVNATDMMKEGSWVTNAAAIALYPNWASTQPDNGGIMAADETAAVKGEDCVVQRQDGYWEDVSCTGAAEYPWACTDGYIWKVTHTQGRIQNTATGHKQCFAEYGSSFVFAAPLNRNDAIQIDFARLAAAAEQGAAISRVWLNMTDGGDEDNAAAGGDGSAFRKNLPFVNWLSPAYPGEEPQNVCVYKSTVAAGLNNPWRTAGCTSAAGHYACFDGADWKVATAEGTLVNGTVQVVPQIGEDYWSYERGNRLCKDQFGSEYYFSAPVTAAEELALDAAIRNTAAQIKNTWLNYYYVSEITSQNNRWFADRLKLGIWQKPVFDNYNNADCALLGSDGSWTDADCNAQYAYACFDGSWTVTGLSGDWQAGFAACDEQNASLFAVPRTPQEMDALLAAMGGEAVWINLSDTGLESQWVANRLRHAWWAENEPANQSNKDCARIGADGSWYAAKCQTETVPFACRRVSGSNIEWFITAASGTWSQGFAICALEYAGSEFFAPHGYGGHSAALSQAALAAVVAADGRDAWLNFSDQEVEDSWRLYQVYGDWADGSLLDDNNDCAYFDRVSEGLGTWYTDSCKYTSATSFSRGYACTNGYEWRIVSTTAATDLRWSEGFTACNSLDTAEDDWQFAAPADALQNAKLKLAMELAGVGQSWINAQDRVSEGDWQINGAETNFAVIADTSATPLTVAEQTLSALLTAALADDEETGIASASWELVADSRYSDVADSGVTVTASNLTTAAAGSGTVTAYYDAPALLQEDAQLTFKLKVTDIPPGTAQAAVSETYVTVTVKAPLLARYDFNDAAFPQRDVSGNGHHALNTTAAPLPAVTDGALSVAAADVMIVPGLAADAANGLDIPADEYTVAFRFSIEAAAAGSWRGLLQKGDSGMERQPALFLFENEESLHLTNSTSESSNRVVNALNIPYQQWLNLIYSKRSDGFDVYLDETLVASYDFNSGETALANDGSLYIGAIPGAAESFTGLIDDVQIFNRRLDETERGLILPAPPVGIVQFTAAGTVTDEYVAAPDNSVTVTLERIRGSKAALTVYVDADPGGSSAQQGTQAEMASASGSADYAFSAAYVSGSGVPVSWPADSRGQQSLLITLDNADDNLREGSESIRLIVADSAMAGVGDPAVYMLRLNDLTPNPYGNFSITTDDNNVVTENDTSVHQVCINRESGTSGEVVVNYLISGSAVAGTDFQYLSSGIQPASAAGSVTFSDGDGSAVCFDIQVLNNPVIGSADKTLLFTITGLNYDAAVIEPVLTAQDSAGLIIRDYAAGEFSFVTSSASCKEPNTDSGVPEELRPATGDVCEIQVVRENTSIYAPAAELQVSLLSHLPDDNPQDDVTFNTRLNWDEIVPGTPAENTQLLTFVISNDLEQEQDEVISLQLLPTNGDGHNEVITQDSLILTVTDVTTPALLTAAVAGAPATGIKEVNEGESVSVSIDRSINTNTAFSVHYAIDVTQTDSVSPGDILSTTLDGVSVADSGSLSFSRAGADNRTLLIQTTDTVEPTDGRVVTLRLDQADPDRIAGLGDQSNANKDTQNFTEVSFRILNTRDSLNDIYNLHSATAVDSVATAVLNSTAYTAVEHITRETQPVHGYISLNFTFDAFRDLYDIEDTALQYDISFYQNGAENALVNGQALTSLLRKASDPSQYLAATGSVSLNPDDGTQFSARLLMPYVTDGNTADVEMHVTFTGNASGEVIEEIYRFRPEVVWRRLEFNGNDECAYNRGTDDVLGWNYGISFNCGDSGNGAGAASAYEIAYNAFTAQMESRQYPGYCWEAEGSSNSSAIYLRSCDSAASVSSLQQFTMTSDRVVVSGAPDYILCGTSGRELILRQDGLLYCSYRTWRWE